MPKQFSGSTRILSLDGVEYGVAADADVSSTLAKWEKEVMMTSGLPMVKLTTVNQKKTGFDVLANGDEKEELRALSESREEIKVIYTDAADNEYHCQATITLEESTSQDNKVPVNVMPLNGNWTYIPG